MLNGQINSKLVIHVDSILEVRICRDMWERIMWVAERRECSYSWVVRYAVFRLIKHVDPKRCVSFIGNPRFEPTLRDSANQRAWRRRLGASANGRSGVGSAEQPKHRHRLCLYGEDELAIRYVAAYYGCTMTHLIRVALELHFERLYASMVRSSGRGANCGAAVSSMNYFQRAFWFWLGIKVYNDVEFHNIALDKRMIRFWRYGKMEYYGRRFCIPKTDVGGNRQNGSK